MRVTVRYLAQAKQAAGAASEQVELPAGCLLRELICRLAERHGEPLRQILLAAAGSPHPAVLLFVGDEQAEPGGRVTLAEGDVVTVLSPMAGG